MASQTRLHHPQLRHSTAGRGSARARCAGSAPRLALGASRRDRRRRSHRCARHGEVLPAAPAPEQAEKRRSRGAGLVLRMARRSRCKSCRGPWCRDCKSPLSRIGRSLCDGALLRYTDSIRASRPGIPLRGALGQHHNPPTALSGRNLTRQGHIACR